MNPQQYEPVDSSPALLVEVTRGELVESRHYGSVAVADVEGKLLAWAGDPELVSFYRSACKPLQAVPLVESGAADHFGLTDAEIAVACGSHGAESIHVEAVMSILGKIGLGPDALACGVDYPLNKAAARELRARGEEPSALHNNCSGKHAGMLALAMFHGWSPDGYRRPEHPVQKTMLGVIADFAGLRPEQVRTGTDGCGVVTLGIPIRLMATSFARFGTPSYWQEPRRTAVQRIAHAMTSYPEMVGYTTGNIDTDVMRAGGGALVAKRGAEGMYCAARLSSQDRASVGIAAKIVDGDIDGRARNPAIVEALRQAGMLEGDVLQALEGYRQTELRNKPGDVVGVVRPAFTLSD